MRSIAQLLAEIETEATNRVQRLADLYREKKLVPLCAKYKLRYAAGMGVFAFYLQDGRSIGDAHDAKAARLSVLIPVIEVLNLPVLGSGTDVFGYYISDI